MNNLTFEKLLGKSIIYTNVKLFFGYFFKTRLSLRTSATSEAICQALAVVFKHGGRLRKLGRLLRSLHSLAMTTLVLRKYGQN